MESQTPVQFIYVFLCSKIYFATVILKFFWVRKKLTKLERGGSCVVVVVVVVVQLEFWVPERRTGGKSLAKFARAEK